MTFDEVVERITKERVIAIIRLRDSSDIPIVAKAIADGGISLIEITLDTPDALKHLESLSGMMPQCIFGAGTVFGELAAQEAVTAGAQFIVSPIFEEAVVDVALDNEIVSIAGAFTPNEIFNAEMYGATYIKLFPSSGGGPGYLKALTGPFPDTLFIPTGGVTLENMKEYLDAGATAVGLGSVLVNDNDVSEGNFDLIRERAAKARQITG